MPHHSSKLALVGLQTLCDRSEEDLICWLHQRDVVSLALRSHLHHKQYAEQVGHLLLFLVTKGEFKDSYKSLLWAAAERPGLITIAIIISMFTTLYIFARLNDQNHRLVY